MRSIIDNKLASLYYLIKLNTVLASMYELARTKHTTDGYSFCEINIQIALDSKFQLQQNFDFWNKFPKKCTSYRKHKMNITIEFFIFELV